jgi:hypothetical protein
MYALFLLKAFGRSDEHVEIALSLSKGCRKAVEGPIDYLSNFKY